MTLGNGQRISAALAMHEAQCGKCHRPLRWSRCEDALGHATCCGVETKLLIDTVKAIVQDEQRIIVPHGPHTSPPHHPR